MPRLKETGPSPELDRDAAVRWLRCARREALWWPEKLWEHKEAREELVRLLGELERGAQPAATIAKAKAFLTACGLLERVERIVTHAEERTRAFEEKYGGGRRGR